MLPWEPSPGKFPKQSHQTARWPGGSTFLSSCKWPPTTTNDSLRLTSTVRISEIPTRWSGTEEASWIKGETSEFFRARVRVDLDDLEHLSLNINCWQSADPHVNVQDAIHCVPWQPAPLAPSYLSPSECDSEEGGVDWDITAGHAFLCLSMIHTICAHISGASRRHKTHKTLRSGVAIN